MQFIIVFIIGLHPCTVLVAWFWFLIYCSFHKFSSQILVRTCVCLYLFVYHTFCIPTSWYQIMETTMITANFLYFTIFCRCYKIPNKGFYFLITLIHLQAIKELKKNEWKRKKKKINKNDKQKEIKNRFKWKNFNIFSFFFIILISIKWEVLWFCSQRKPIVFSELAWLTSFSLIRVFLFFFFFIS